MKDIPHLAYTHMGSYDMSTLRKRLAACEATLAFIAETAPAAYHAQGPAVVLEQMRHVAQETLTRLRAIRDTGE